MNTIKLFCASLLLSIAFMQTSQAAPNAECKHGDKKILKNPMIRQVSYVPDLKPTTSKPTITKKATGKKGIN